jgi:uncharacterized protein involved in outer membrane biogenesis
MSGSARTALRTLGTGVRQLLAVRWVRVLAVLLVIVFGVRLSLDMLLASVLSRLAAERDLSVAWEDLDLRLRGGSGKVSWLTVTPRGSAGEEAAPLLEIEYAVFDLDVLDLLKGELTIRRAEVDGADLHLERASDGSWSFERHLAAAQMLSLVEGAPAEQAEHGAPAEAEAPREPQPIVLHPPLALEALRLQNARVAITDRTFEPPRSIALATNAWISSLGTSHRPTRFGADLYGAELLDAAHVEGEARWREGGVDVSLRAQGGALRPRALADYLEPLRIRPVADAVYGNLRADLSLTAVGELRDALAAQVTISDVHLSADGSGSFALEELELDVQSASGERARIGALEVSGARGAVELSPERALRVAGFELLAPERQPAPPPTWEDLVASALDLSAPGALPGWIALLGRSDPEAYPWALERLAFGDCSFEVVDLGVEPPARFALEVRSVELLGVEHDPAATPSPIQLSARMEAPGLADSIALAGTLVPWAPHRTLELTLDVQGISPASADAYLEVAGLERTLADGRLQLALSAEAIEEGGVTRARIEAREMALEDSGELLGVREVALRDIVLDPAARKLRLGELEVSGPRLAFVRDPSHSLLALGLRTSGGASRAPEEATAEQPEQAAAQPKPAPVPEEAVEQRAPVALEIGRAAWLDSRITFVDEAADPPASFAIQELSLELKDLALSSDPDAPAPPPATLTGRLRAEGVAREVALTGQVRPDTAAHTLEAELELAASGLRGVLLAQYLRPLGIVPQIQDGELHAKARAAVRGGPEGLTFSLAVEDARFTDAGVELVSVGAIEVDDLRFGASGIEVGRAAVQRPFARIRRESSGALVLGGVRIERPAQEGIEQPAKPATPRLPWPALPPLAIGEVTLAGASVALSDASLVPPLELELHCDAAVRDLAGDGRRSTFELGLSVPGALERLSVRGGFAATPHTFDVDLEVEGGGLQSGPLADLLPQGLALESERGRLAARLDAALRRSESGAEHAARVELTGVRWGESESEPWFALERFLLDVRRLDLAAREVEIGALRTEGLTLALRRDSEGGLHALGMRYAPGGAAPERAVAIEASAPAEPANKQPSRPESALQRLKLGDVHLALDRLSIQDETLGADARPLVLRAAFDVDPCEVVAPDPAALPPLEWRVTSSIEGIVDRAQVDGRLSLFAEEPRLEAQISATGLRTAGVVECLPTLAGKLSGEIEQGELGGRLEAVLTVRRSHPTDLALDRPFGGELRLQDLAYRDAPGGEVLLGVEAVEVLARQIDLQRGVVHLEQIEVRTPRAVLERTVDQAHAAGFALDLRPTPEPAQDSTPTAPDEAKPLAAEDTEAGELADLRIDRVAVSGLDVRIADRTLEPPLVVQLADLELEASGISSRDLAAGGAVSFSGEVGARLVPQGGDLFEALVLSGRVAPLPAPSGWVQMDLEGLELVPLAPLASAKGLTVEDGALDLSSRVRLKGERGAAAGVSVVFSDLSLSEPEGGFVEKVLSLPMTLDNALFLLRNPQGEHRFEVDVDVGPEGVGTGALAAAAASAAVQVVAAAVAGAPFRMLGAVLPGGGEEAAPVEVLTFEFPSGSSELDAQARASLGELALRARVQPSLNLVVRHELGTADLEFAQQLANPDPAQCLELAERLRRRKAALWRERGEAAARARALYAIGSPDSEESAGRVRDLEAELAEVESGLDRVLEVLRAGSPRQQAKRTRAVARELADLRLEEVAAIVRRELAGRDPQRLVVRAPRSTAEPEGGVGRVVVELSQR